MAVARPYGIVAHEAAHVVVGVALGARLRSAVVRDWYEGGKARAAWTWFPDATDTVDALISAAGVAWSGATRDGLGAIDAADLRTLVRGSRNAYRACIVAAAAILETRATAHARVVRALIEHDLTHADIERLAIGVSPARLREDDT